MKPEPAEACTEIGADDMPESLGSFVLCAIILVLIIGVIALLVGYFV